MTDEFTLEDALIVLRRRIWLFLAPAAGLFALAVIVIALLPPLYTAKGTILIESQKISEDLAKGSGRIDADERIQTIKQRVVTRARLLEVADRFQIFPTSAGLTESERVERMRERLAIDPIRTSVLRDGWRQDGAIAFHVGYTDGSAEVAYKVANEFMSLFMSEDARARTSAASDTTEFFATESRRLRDAVDSLDEKIAAFKLENARALPEHLSLHLELMERARRDLSALNAQVLSYEEELSFLETQLAAAGNGAAAGPGDELSRLKSELARMRALYKDAHPFVQSLRDEIAALERQSAPSDAVRRLTDELDAARDTLADAERAGTPDASAIEAARLAVTQANARLSEQFALEISSRNGAADAPLRARIAQTRTRIERARLEAEGARAQIADLEARVAQTPDVERRLSLLTRDYDNLQKEYKDVVDRHQSAQIAENLEDNQKSEKFRIIEPAVLPEKASSPERAKLIALALFAALGAGAAAAAAAETVFGTVRGRAHLASLVGAHPIAVIPFIPLAEERRKRVFAAPAQPSAGDLAAGLALAVVAGSWAASALAQAAPYIHT